MILNYQIVLCKKYINVSASVVPMLREKKLVSLEMIHNKQNQYQLFKRNSFAYFKLCQ